MAAAATVGALKPEDRQQWDAMWRAYLAFYATELTPAQYDHTWARLHDGRMHGLAARDADGGLLGLAHFLLHEHGWTMGPACYLQDLFVDPAARTGGIGRALIEAVTQAARTLGASRLYWLTRADNAAARRLYDSVALHDGFIVYRHSL